MTRDLRGFKSEHSIRNRAARVAWGLVQATVFRHSPRPLHGMRRTLLRAFGAKVGRGAKVYGSARVWAPWNLQLGDYSVVGDYVDIYNVAPVVVEANSVVSQYVYLCAATHDHRDPTFPLMVAPISIATGVWIAAGAFVGPGVSVGVQSVVGARACVMKDVPNGEVLVGNPARTVKNHQDSQW